MKKKINFSIAATLLISLFSIFSLASVSAQTDYSNCPAGYGGMMGGYGGMMSGYYGTGGLFFGWITSLLVIVLIIAATYWLIKSAQKKR
ncbi:MAG: hypothetical protein Q8N63_00945 [Nanoarchaeota archaeon]|nr:hypothetical protein [Nanoarchaeota archaeon]